MYLSMNSTPCGIVIVLGVYNTKLAMYRILLPRVG
jgi:hypothetical protein